MSGYSTRSHNILTFQRRVGLQPVVLTSPKHPRGGSPCETRDGIPYYRTQRPAHRRTLPYASELTMMARFARRIGDVARAERVKVLHAHSPVLNGLPAIWAARRLGLPAVYESRAFWEDAAVDHGTTRENSVRYRVTRALETLAFRQATRVVVIAQAMRREIIGRGIGADRIHVVPNGVDADRFTPAPRDETLAQRLGLAGGPVFGFIGSFYHYEGLRFLIEKFPAVQERVPSARVLLVGGGEDEAALRAAAVDGVILAGQVPYNRVTDYYSLIDVFVCPRRRMRLTELVTPLKPLEAMAAGLPVLASDVGGLAELIEHGSTGLLFRAEDASAFVREAVSLASDPGLRARLGASAREHVRSERSWSRVVSQYPAIYGFEPAASAVA
jgi:PEP-CTERM/exosortase A-associated glycosyltransferase